MQTDRLTIVVQFKQNSFQQLVRRAMGWQFSLPKNVFQTSCKWSPKISQINSASIAYFDF